MRIWTARGAWAAPQVEPSLRIWKHTITKSSRRLCWTCTSSQKLLSAHVTTAAAGRNWLACTHIQLCATS
eukprot:1138762-Pelagomonas_calceolata.AAC.3